MAKFSARQYFYFYGNLSEIKNSFFTMSYIYIAHFLKQATVKQLIVNLSTYHILSYPLLECLHCLTRDLPNAPLGKKVSDQLTDGVYTCESYYQNITGNFGRELNLYIWWSELSCDRERCQIKNSPVFLWRNFHDHNFQILITANISGDSCCVSFKMFSFFTTAARALCCQLRGRHKAEL